MALLRLTPVYFHEARVESTQEYTVSRKQKRVMYAGQPVKPDGEWPTLDPLPVEDDSVAAGVAVGIDAGAQGRNLDGTADDLTPSTLIGEHRPD